MSTIVDGCGHGCEIDDQEIINKMNEYFVSVLEVPRQEFSGMPACPFVKHEREAGKIRYDICVISGSVPSDENISKLRELADDPFFTTLLFVDPFKRVSVSECVTYGIELTKRAIDRRMIAIGVHPDDQFEVSGFLPRCVPYVTMLCQSIDVLEEAKRGLGKTAYYNRWTRSAIEYNTEQIGRFLVKVN